LFLFQKSWGSGKVNCEICQQVVKFGKIHEECVKKGYFEQGDLLYSRRMVQGAWRILSGLCFLQKTNAYFRIAKIL